MQPPRRGVVRWLPWIMIAVAGLLACSHVAGVKVACGRNAGAAKPSTLKARRILDNRSYVKNGTAGIITTRTVTAITLITTVVRPGRLRAVLRGANTIDYNFTFTARGLVTERAAAKRPARPRKSRSRQKVAAEVKVTEILDKCERMLLAANGTLRFFSDDGKSRVAFDLLDSPTNKGASIFPWNQTKNVYVFRAIDSKRSYVEDSKNSRSAVDSYSNEGLLKNVTIEAQILQPGYVDLAFLGALQLAAYEFRYDDSTGRVMNVTSLLKEPLTAYGSPRDYDMDEKLIKVFACSRELLLLPDGGLTLVAPRESGCGYPGVISSCPIDWLPKKLASETGQVHVLHQVLNKLVYTLRVLHSPVLPNKLVYTLPP